MPLKGDTIAMVNGTHSYNERRGFVVKAYRLKNHYFALTGRKSLICDIVIRGWRFIAQSPSSMSVSSRLVLTEKKNKIFY
jgi:hypothetical protein